MPYTNNLRQASLKATTAQTAASLVAAASGEVIGIASIFVSCGSAMTVSIKTANTTVWEAYVAANSGFSMRAPFGEFLFESNSGVGLTVTTSAAGSVFVSVLYDVTV
jgi:hypothetical protein